MYKTVFPLWPIIAYGTICLILCIVFFPETGGKLGGMFQGFIAMLWSGIPLLCLALYLRFGNSGKPCARLTKTTAKLMVPSLIVSLIPALWFLSIRMAYQYIEKFGENYLFHIPPSDYLGVITSLAFYAYLALNVVLTLRKQYADTSGPINITAEK